MGHTLAEKIIMKHIGGKDVKPGDLVVVEPDCVVVHDIYTAFLRDKMKKMGLTKVWNTDKIVIMHDHLMPACLEGDPRSLEAGYELVKEYGTAISMQQVVSFISWYRNWAIPNQVISYL